MTHCWSENEPSPKKRPRRSRGFGGCTTCRMKRLRCDEHKPVCSACISHGSQCAYEKNLFFDLDNHSGSDQARFRRPILTEEERRLMSQCLTASIGEQSALDLSYSIDEECEAAAPAGALQISHGPFGAFRSLLPGSKPRPVHLQDDTDFMVSDLEQKTGNGFCPADRLASPTSLALSNSLFDHTGDGDQQLPMQMSWDFPIDGTRIQEILEDLPTPEMQPFDIGLPDFTSCGPLSPAAAQSRPASIHLPSLSTGLSGTAVPAEAVPLLKHYQSTVLRSLTPFRHSKTPWHILFLPQAKNCLAALTLGDDVDSASLCSFYGTLAISAFSLQGVSPSSKWMDVAEKYEAMARCHMVAAVRSAYDIPKTAKYKSMLIALLTMIQLSVLSGNSDQTENCFLEAEKFIRLRGLCKNKSRKVRLLHHCYAFERILYESTLASGSSRSQRKLVRKAIEASRTIVAGQDALSFRLGHWTDLEHAMRRIKGRDEGENDLHLQNPGDWSATLYPEIFGVEEQILLILSLIIRLAKEKEGSEPGIGLSIKTFFDRAKAIEQLIQQRERPVSFSDVDSLQEAMQLALSIYFYRRLYDVDPSVLQDKVRGVLNCLIRSQSVPCSDSFGAARYNWPAFVAAKEATDPTAQASFSAWFEDAASRTGLRLFRDTLQKVEGVWTAKHENANGGFLVNG